MATAFNAHILTRRKAEFMAAYSARDRDAKKLIDDYFAFFDEEDRTVNRIHDAAVFAASDAYPFT